MHGGESNQSGTARVSSPDGDVSLIAAETVGEALGTAARVYGEACFVRCDGAEVSYAAANARANRVANAFAELGVGRGDRVAILAQNRLEYLDLWFGLSKIGAIELPISTAYKGGQILHALRRAETRHIVIDARSAAVFSDVVRDVDCRPIVLDAGCDLAGALDYRALVREASYREPPVAGVTGADVVAIMNTSGTTGPSKGVRLPNAQQLSLARTMALTLGMTRKDVFYNYFPLFHNTAQAMITLSTLLAGGSMLLTEKFSLSSFWRDVRAHDVSLFYFIGEMLHLLVHANDEERGADIRLRAGWGIGAAPSDVAAFEQRYGVKLGTGYGSTEGNVPVVRSLGYAPASASAGRVIPGFKVRIVDDAGADMPVGEVGEVVETADDPRHIMQGYDGDEAASAQALRDGWLYTGDAGRFDADGNFYFVARIKDVIRVRGENISGSEIEQEVLRFPGVLEVAAIAVPAELGGDDVKVVIVPAKGSSIDREALIAHCAETLPKYAVPRYVEITDALPKTETNKVQKHILRKEGVNARTWDRKRGLP